MDSSTGLVNGTAPPASETDVKAWEKQVWSRHRGLCSNCGTSERLRARMVVPLEAGGQYVEFNGVLLCRSCEMASETYAKSAVPTERLLNFWVSRKLSDRLQLGLKTASGFNSMGSLIRYLLAKYVEDESRFDDLELYQDRGADVKINVWVEKDRYNTFKAMLDKRGITVTDAIKSLIVMYQEQAEPLMGPREIQ